MELLTKTSIFSISAIGLFILFASAFSFQFALASASPIIIGNGPIPASINIFNEGLRYTSPSTAIFTWDTNNPATSRVVYGDKSQKVMFSNLEHINYGYDKSTQQDDTLLINHSVTIGGLTPNMQYFFRPESRIDNYANTGNEKTIAPGTVSNGTGGGCDYVTSYLRFGDNNEAGEVTRLQTFLRDTEGFSNLAVTGVFDQATFDAVSQFQLKYAGDVLAPWGINFPTGYVYYTTLKKINEIYCGETLPFTDAQIAEMEEFKTLLGEVRENKQVPNIDWETIGQGDVDGDDNIEDDNESLQASVILSGGDDKKKRSLFFRILDWFRK